MCPIIYLQKSSRVFEHSDEGAVQVRELDRGEQCRREERSANRMARSADRVLSEVSADRVLNEVHGGARRGVQLTTPASGHPVGGVTRIARGLARRLTRHGGLAITDGAVFGRLGRVAGISFARRDRENSV